MQEYYRGKTEERGKNVLEDEEKKSWAESFLEQLNDPLIFILFVAAAIPCCCGNTAIWQLFWLWCC